MGPGRGRGRGRGRPKSVPIVSFGSAIGARMPPETSKASAQSPEVVFKKAPASSL